MKTTVRRNGRRNTELSNSVIWLYFIHPTFQMSKEWLKGSGDTITEFHIHNIGAMVKIQGEGNAVYSLTVQLIYRHS